MQDGIIHLLRRAAELRGEGPDSGWDWIVQEPAFASLLPLIYYSVPDAILPLSEAARERCAQAYYQTVACNLCLYRELGSVLEALRDAEIPVIILKGAALAVTLYPNIGLRPIGDVDLLVPQARLSEALACLKALGYIEPIPDVAPGLNRVVGHHVSLGGGKDIPLHVEVHWTLAAGGHDRHAPSMAWFWQQTEPLTLGPGAEEPGSGGELALLLTLTPTAHLLYLAAHLIFQHGGALTNCLASWKGTSTPSQQAGEIVCHQFQLLWLYDIDLMVRREADRLDWDELLHRAQEFRWAAALHATLQCAQDRFGTPLPQGFLDALAEVSDHRSAHLVERKVGPLQTRALRVRNAMSALDWQARLRLASAIAFPSPTYMRWRYLSRFRAPLRSLLWPLCYPYRWLVILREGLSTALKLALRGSRNRAGGKEGTPR